MPIPFCKSIQKVLKFYESLNENISLFFDQLKLVSVGAIFCINVACKIFIFSTRLKSFVNCNLNTDVHKMYQTVTFLLLFEKAAWLCFSLLSLLIIIVRFSAGINSHFA